MWIFISEKDVLKESKVVKQYKLFKISETGFRRQEVRVEELREAESEHSWETDECIEEW